MFKERKSDELCLSIIDSVYDFLKGEVDVDVEEFISTHRFYSSWFKSLDEKETSLLDTLLIAQISIEIKEYQFNHISKEQLRHKLLKVLETYF